MDNQDKKLEFLHRLAKLGLQHFDSGGFIGQQATTATPLNAGVGAEGGAVANALTPSQGTPGQQNPYVQSNATNPNTGIIGTIGGALGLNNNFQASSANVTPGTNAGQLSTAYTGAQNALAGQQAIANTLAPQVGNAVNQQNALAAQYQALANGQGPNVAQNQLAQATGANVANQAALMAGQRGSSQNVGLLARQNAMQGAATQQNAAGQAATLGSQQQIAAQNNLANLSNAQIGQAGQGATNLSSAAQGEQGILQNANTGFNNAIVGMQSNINNVNSQTAAANQNMGANILGGIGSMAQGAGGLGSLFAEGGVVDQSADSLGTFTPSSDSSQGPSIPGTSTLPAAPSLSQSSGGGKSGGGGGLGSMIGMVAALADGGQITPNMGSFNPYQGGSQGGPSVPATASLPVDAESFSKDFASMKKQKPDPTQGATNMNSGDPSIGDSGISGLPGAASSPMTLVAAMGGKVPPGPHKCHVANYLAGGGKVPAMVSPGEIRLSPEQLRKVVHEGANPLKLGERIQGQAKVKGDSYANDNVRRDLSEGDFIIDRENSRDPKKAMAFIHATLAKKGLSK